MSTSSEFGNEPSRVENGVVVSIDYTLHVDGEMMDASEQDEPLQYLHGKGQIISGLERELAGLAVGEKKKVLVRAAEGYGDFDPLAVIQIVRAEFPEDIPLEIGTPLQLRNVDGEMMDARISAVEADLVELDFNHPLAGKDLEFDVTIVALRQPTPEELEHGHVHHHGSEDDEDFDDFDDDDEDAEDETADA